MAGIIACSSRKPRRELTEDDTSRPQRSAFHEVALRDFTAGPLAVRRLVLKSHNVYAEAEALRILES